MILPIQSERIGTDPTIATLPLPDHRTTRIVELFKELPWHTMVLDTCVKNGHTYLTGSRAYYVTTEDQAPSKPPIASDFDVLLDIEPKLEVQLLEQLKEIAAGSQGKVIVTDCRDYFYPKIKVAVKGQPEVEIILLRGAASAIQNTRQKLGQNAGAADTAPLQVYLTAQSMLQEAQAIDVSKFPPAWTVIVLDHTNPSPADSSASTDKTPHQLATGLVRIKNPDALYQEQNVLTLVERATTVEDLLSAQMMNFKFRVNMFRALTKFAQNLQYADADYMYIGDSVQQAIATKLAALTQQDQSKFEEGTATQRAWYNQHVFNHFFRSVTSDPYKTLLWMAEYPLAAEMLTETNQIFAQLFGWEKNYISLYAPCRMSEPALPTYYEPEAMGRSPTRLHLALRQCAQFIEENNLTSFDDILSAILVYLGVTDGNVVELVSDGFLNLTPALNKQKIRALVLTAAEATNSETHTDTSFAEGTVATDSVALVAPQAESNMPPILSLTMLIQMYLHCCRFTNQEFSIYFSNQIDPLFKKASPTS